VDHFNESQRRREEERTREQIRQLEYDLSERDRQIRTLETANQQNREVIEEQGRRIEELEQQLKELENQ